MRSRAKVLLMLAGMSNPNDQKALDRIVAVAPSPRHYAEWILRYRRLDWAAELVAGGFATKRDV